MGLPSFVSLWLLVVFVWVLFLFNLTQELTVSVTIVTTPGVITFFCLFSFLMFLINILYIFLYQMMLSSILLIKNPLLDISFHKNNIFFDQVCCEPTVLF
eukprot:UN30185